MTDRSTERASPPARIAAALLVAAGMSATVGGALLFEHVGGYIPCALCLAQRTPYYIAIPVALVALAAGLLRAPDRLVRVLLVAVALLMGWAAYLGVFHAGFEWGWWAGPADCGAVGGFDLGGGDLLSQLDGVRPPSCEEPALLVLGFSLAAWNALAASVLAVIALFGALAGRRRGYSGSSSVSQ
ncbi:disulfide bond formation protein B [Aureimonas populi]|uniref:Disulfide bond formation protein B n=1 Tax=Aureimonas populi TaxID=1701758 RepID=A0ABW5CHP6_9HYPH|nr:disulfide bond formation protein B [Aureimonas populi]